MQNREEKLGRFNKTHNLFLTSLCEELEHQHSVDVMTLLVKISVRDFIEMQRGNKEITIDKGTQLGIFNPWFGTGSLLGIELEKDLTFKSDMIKDVQIEGSEKEELHTVQFASELVGDSWKSVKEIKELARERNAGNALESLIEEANGEIVEEEVCEPEEELGR